MFDAPLDALYVWLGLAAVSVAVLAVVLSLASVPPPSPIRVANAMDEVAASPNEAVRHIALDVDAVSLRPWQVGIRTSGGTARATVTFGPVTPVRRGALRDVLSGRSPAETFETPDAFESALARARRRAGGWTDAPATLVVRRVSWGGVNGTLVG